MAKSLGWQRIGFMCLDVVSGQEFGVAVDRVHVLSGGKRPRVWGWQWIGLLYLDVVSG